MYCNECKVMFLVSAIYHISTLWVSVVFHPFESLTKPVPLYFNTPILLHPSFIILTQQFQIAFSGVTLNTPVCFVCVWRDLSLCVPLSLSVLRLKVKGQKKSCEVWRKASQVHPTITSTSVTTLSPLFHLLRLCNTRSFFSSVFYSFTPSLLSSYQHYLFSHFTVYIFVV